MDKPPTTWESITEQALALPLLEKVRLVERLAATIQHDLAKQQPFTTWRSLYGLWQKTDVTDDDIATLRDALWGHSSEVGE